MLTHKDGPICLVLTRQKLGFIDRTVYRRRVVWQKARTCQQMLTVGRRGRVIGLIGPDGSTLRVADGIAFPNGMVITPDNRTLIVSESFTGRLLAFDVAADGTLDGRRVWAEGVAPDGICLDADGTIWTGTRDQECVRVAEGGEILERIPLDRHCFATMLGGPDGRTLFIMANQFLGVDRFDEMLARRSGQVLTAEVRTAHAGWP